MTPDQFAHPMHTHEGSTDHLRTYGGKYLLEDNYSMIVAHRIGRHGLVAPGWGPSTGLPNPRRVGYLSWFSGHIDRKPDGTPDDRSNINGGRIYKTYVSGPHQRKGLASAMLDMARERHPEMEIRHSGALSDEGRAWAEAKP